jgi:hypothetical protein
MKRHLLAGLSAAASFRRSSKHRRRQQQTEDQQEDDEQACLLLPYPPILSTTGIKDNEVEGTKQSSASLLQNGPSNCFSRSKDSSRSVVVRRSYIRRHATANVLMDHRERTEGDGGVESGDEEEEEVVDESRHLLRPPPPPPPPPLPPYPMANQRHTLPSRTKTKTREVSKKTNEEEHEYTDVASGDDECVALVAAANDIVTGYQRRRPIPLPPPLLLLWSNSSNGHNKDDVGKWRILGNWFKRGNSYLFYYFILYFLFLRPLLFFLS